MCSFIRSLKMNEGQRLQRILRTSKKRTVLRRAQVILMSAQHYRVQEIAQATLLHEEYVRELIRRFNREGLALLKEPKRSGRPMRFGEEEKAAMAEFALCPPRAVGQPFSRWSLEKLRAFLIQRRVVASIGLETLRRILEEKNIRLQRTKTWKESKDPKFESKKNS
jgi:transposase